MSAATAEISYPLAPRLRGIAAFTLYAANMVVAIDMTVANVAVPHIAGNLGATLEQGSWVVTSYAVAEAITVPLTGWLAGRFGTVRTILTCIAGFTFFSLMCGLSVTLPMLVLCRIGQGMSGGPILSLVQALLVRMYPSHELAGAYGMYTLTVMGGTALGPVIGGMIVDQWSWHWVFLVNIPVGVASTFIGYLLLRPVETQTARPPIDRMGLVLLVVWVGALQLMLDTGRNKDWFADPTIVAMAVVAAVGLCMFIIWEFTDEHPAVNLRLLRHRPYALCVLSSALGFAAHFCAMVVVPQWLQATLGYTAEQAGMVTGASAVGSILATRVALVMLVRMDPRLAVTIGSVVAGVMALIRTRWSMQTEYFELALTLGLQGFGVTLMGMTLNAMALNTMSLDETASGSGLLTFVRTISIAIATALILTFWSVQQASWRADMVGSINYGRAADLLAGAGAGGIAAPAIVSSLVDQQANTIAMLQTFFVAAAAMFFGAAAVWTLPRIEIARFKSSK
ncbi:MAG TPA: DHA2 family efflux MFS transporter permease subunit [Novosphingobium sp.]|nr:DHA2 family efflux MFS transporter permease subunit [Novosphingobium sp.]